MRQAFLTDSMVLNKHKSDQTSDFKLIIND